VIDVGSIPRLVINVSPMSDVARSCTSRSVAHFDTPSADTANRLFVCGRLHGSSFRSNYVPTKRRWRLAGTRVSRGLSSQAPGFARTLCPDPRAMFSAWSSSQRNLPETTSRSPQDETKRASSLGWPICPIQPRRHRQEPSRAQPFPPDCRSRRRTLDCSTLRRGSQLRDSQLIDLAVEIDSIFLEQSQVRL